MGKKIKILQPKEVKLRMEDRLCVEISTLETEDLSARGLALALYHGATCPPEQRKEAKESVKACLKQCNEGAFEGALELLFEKEETERLLCVLKIRREGPYSEAVFRTPFRSSNIQDYVDRMVIPTIYRWIHGTGCPVELLDYITNSDIEVPEEYDISNRLALELRMKNPVVVEAIRQILYLPQEKTRDHEGRKGRSISKEILQGVIRSGHGELICILKEILKDKSYRSEIREWILMAADEGSVDTFVGFIHLIYEETLYRSPGVSRIMDTWLWLGFGALEPEMAQWILKECITMLNQPKAWNVLTDQKDMLRIHLALWSLAVYDVTQIHGMLYELLTSKSVSHKISAIHFVNNVFHDYLEFPMTCELLEQVLRRVSSNEPYNEEMELISWIIPNLIPKDYEETIPDTSWERQHVFGLLEKTLELIGTEERVFCGKPFVWSICRLRPELVVESMLRMAYVTKDRSMIRSLARNIQFFTTKQRGFFYEYLLDPVHWREDDFFLQEHQKDRSPSNRQLIQAKLEFVQQVLKDKGEEIRRM